MRLHGLSDNSMQLNTNVQSVFPTKGNVNHYSVIEVS